MADPTGTHSDGVLVWGTQVVTINSVAYIAESISVDYDSKEINSMDQDGLINKRVLIEQPATGSCTLQLAAETTVVPTIGHTVPLTPVGGGSAVNFLVKKIGTAFSQDGETKVSIDIVEKLN